MSYFDYYCSLICIKLFSTLYVIILYMYIFSHMLNPIVFVYIKYNCNIMQPLLILLWEIESSKRPDQQEAVSDEEATETETEDEAEVS